MSHITDRFTAPGETAEDRLRAYMRLPHKEKLKLWKKAAKQERKRRKKSA